jgi:hypothetical protein
MDWSAAHRAGDRVRVRGRAATFVKSWGAAGAVVRFDDLPAVPKVVALHHVQPFESTGAAPRPSLESWNRR